MAHVAETGSVADAGEPLVDASELPRHVAIIMDGNRRWARLHDLPELEGHAAGVEAIRILLKHAFKTLAWLQRFIEDRFQTEIVG